MDCIHKDEDGDCKFDGKKCLASTREDCPDYKPIWNETDEADFKLHSKREGRNGNLYHRD